MKMNIKFVVFDFDGVFTNGNFYFSNNEISKSYNAKDAYSLKIMHVYARCCCIFLNFSAFPPPPPSSAISRKKAKFSSAYSCMCTDRAPMPQLVRRTVHTQGEGIWYVHAYSCFLILDFCSHFTVAPETPREAGSYAELCRVGK